MQPTTEDIVYFYDQETEFVRKEHIFLNNFEPSPLKDEKGKSFMSVEHYYQAHKFDNFADGEEFKKAFEDILIQEDADKCKKKMKTYINGSLKDKWQIEKWGKGYKDLIMKKALMFKFSQHRDMLKGLLETKGKKLIERSESDSYWGGFLPNSLNKLGEMLMKLRDYYLKNGKVYLEGCGLEPIELKE